VRLVFAKGMRQLVIGLAVGILAAYALSQELTRAMDIPAAENQASLCERPLHGHWPPFRAA
jgi:hypothetical protein